MKKAEVDLGQLTFRNLQPSQFYISEVKLRAVQKWFKPGELDGFPPIPLKIMGGLVVMLDGHTRAVAAMRHGLDRVPFSWESETLDWEMYRRCVAECARQGIDSADKLVSRVVPEKDYELLWDAWCDRMQAEVIAKRTG